MPTKTYSRAKRTVKTILTDAKGRFDAAPGHRYSDGCVCDACTAMWNGVLFSDIKLKRAPKRKVR